MPRVSKVDLCMFCGEAPCTCRATKKAAPKPRARKAVEPTPIATAAELPAEKADVTAAMRAASQVKHRGATTKEDHDAVDEEAAILADPEMVAAIQALEPLMHPTERRRFEAALQAQVDPRDRAAAWKARNGRP